MSPSERDLIEQKVNNNSKKYQRIKEQEKKVLLNLRPLKLPPIAVEKHESVPSNDSPKGSESVDWAKQPKDKEILKKLSPYRNLSPDRNPVYSSYRKSRSLLRPSVDTGTSIIRLEEVGVYGNQPTPTSPNPEQQEPARHQGFLERTSELPHFKITYLHGWQNEKHGQGERQSQYSGTDVNVNIDFRLLQRSQRVESKLKSTRQHSSANSPSEYVRT